MPRGCIRVIAGVNGAGKSSIAGAALREAGGDYYDPDEATRAILARNPGATLEEANAAAWTEGRRLLERAIDEGLSFAFETTLGGKTITRLLSAAIEAGMQVRVFYMGLWSPELHVERVRRRAARGGHAVPEERIRSRYVSSRANLLRLLPRLTELRVYDNSAEGDPAAGVAPAPFLVLHLGPHGLDTCPADRVPDWAKPIVLAALRLGRRA